VVFILLATAVALLLFKSKKAKEQKHVKADSDTEQTRLAQDQKHPEQAYLHELYAEHGFGEMGKGEVAELATHNAPQELETKSRIVR